MKKTAIQISMINNNSYNTGGHRMPPQKIKEIRLLACDEEVLDEADDISATRPPRSASPSDWTGAT